MPRYFLALVLTIWSCAAVAGSPSDPLAPPEGVGPDTRAAYEQGRLIFNGHWRPSGTAGPDDFEGLGPLYNRISCASCHNAGGRGKPPAGPNENFLTALVRIGIVADDGTVEPHPRYGSQIQDRAVPGVEPEARLSLTWKPVVGRYPDGSSYELRKPVLDISPDPGPKARWSIRVAPQIRGVGRLAQMVSGNDGSGRFGWKAAMPSLAAQNASALSQDMGITSKYFPVPNCPGDGATCGGGPDETNGIRLMTLTLFTDLLPSPAESRHINPKGEMLFMKIGCADCHTPVLPLRSGPGSVAAYSDLQLHDMGKGLDDGLPEGQASSAEWRTAPLWGIGELLRNDPGTPLLHDGRARGAEEAILWHDGEASRARREFMSLSVHDRYTILDFLTGL